MRLLDGPPEVYLPTTLAYFDDVQLVAHNRWCGELLAIEEFNEAHEMRKLERHPFLATTRVFKHAPWIGQIYGLHVLDHPRRQPAEVGATVEARALENPYLN